ncbi:MAG: Nif11-like leader peptide family natural product precursor [Cyanobacteria bacterium J06633_8]
MSQEQIDQFYQVVQKDTALQESLKTIDSLESGLKLVTELAKEKGYIFTSSDLKEWMKAKSSIGSENTEEELSEEDLTILGCGNCRDCACGGCGACQSCKPGSDPDNK